MLKNLIRHLHRHLKRSDVLFVELLISQGDSTYSAKEILMSHQGLPIIQIFTGIALRNVCSNADNCLSILEVIHMAVYAKMFLVLSDILPKHSANLQNMIVEC